MNAAFEGYHQQLDPTQPDDLLHAKTDQQHRAFGAPKREAPLLKAPAACVALADRRDLRSTSDRDRLRRQCLCAMLRVPRPRPEVSTSSQSYAANTATDLMHATYIYQRTVQRKVRGSVPSGLPTMSMLSITYPLRRFRQTPMQRRPHHAKASIFLRPRASPR